MHHIPNPVTDSEQTLFNAVARAMLAQDGPSLSPEGKPAYRGQDGRRCAIGHLLPDDLYRPEIEGKVAHVALAMVGLSPTKQKALTSLADIRPRPDFLDALQQVHDMLPFEVCQRSPETYRHILAQRLSEFAIRRGLSDAAVFEALPDTHRPVLTSAVKE